MKKIFQCRRSSLALLAMVCLTILGIVKDQDVSLALAGIVTAVSAANAYQQKGVKSE